MNVLFVALGELSSDSEFIVQMVSSVRRSLETNLDQAKIDSIERFVDPVHTRKDAPVLENPPPPNI